MFFDFLGLEGGGELYIGFAFLGLFGEGEVSGSSVAGIYSGFFSEIWFWFRFVSVL